MPHYLIPFGINPNTFHKTNHSKENEILKSSQKKENNHTVELKTQLPKQIFRLKENPSPNKKKHFVILNQIRLSINFIIIDDDDDDDEEDDDDD